MNIFDLTTHKTEILLSLVDGITKIQTATPSRLQTDSEWSWQ